MSLKTCNPSLEANAELAPHQSRILYDAMRSIVWIVRISRNVLDGENERYDSMWYSTGFCTDSNGYIITSALRVKNGRQFEVRKLGDEDNMYYYATKIRDYSRVGVAVLKVNLTCDFGMLADPIDLNLNVGRDVYGISHAGVLSYTLLRGRLVSDLKSKNELRISDPHLSNNVDSLGEEVKFLHIYGFFSMFNSPVNTEALGAPVFNSRGKIIGMIAAIDRGFDYAVEATSLRSVVNSLNPAYSGGSGTSSSKRSKRRKSGRR